MVSILFLVILCLLVSITLSELATSVTADLRSTLLMFLASVLQLLEVLSPRASAKAFLHFSETSVCDAGLPLTHFAQDQSHSVHCSHALGFKSYTSFSTTDDKSEGSTTAANKCTCARPDLFLKEFGIVFLISSVYNSMLDGRSLGFGKREDDISNLTKISAEISTFK